MPSVLQMSGTRFCLSAANVQSCRTFRSLTDGRPPCLPRARAAASPAIVRSRMRSLSNSAIAPKTWNTSFPPLVPVSSCSCRLLNCTPRSCKSFIDWMRCARERPRRSNRQTTSVSPARTKSRAPERPGRSVRLPEAVSVKIFSHPAARSVLLEREGLVGGGDAGVADQHSAYQKIASCPDFFCSFRL
jgi:hypothetical protein